MSSITELGNGAGLIFLTDPTATVILNTIGNTPDGARAAIKEVMASTPAISGTRAVFTVQITAVAAPANINSLTVNGVSIISGAIAATVGDPEQTILDLVNDINATVSVPNYTAQAVGEFAYISYDTIGTTPNGDVVAINVDAPITESTSATIEGGSNANSLVSPTWGRLVYLDTAGVAGTLSGTDITAELLSTFFGRPQEVQTVSDSGGAIVVTRDGSTTFVEVQSSGVLAQIGQVTMTNATYGDRIILWGKQIATSIQVVDVTATIGSVPNIYTDAASDFDSEGAGDTITLIYLNDTLLGEGWFELTRSNSQPITVAQLQNGGVAIPVQGTVTQAVNFAGGTLTVTPGTTKGIIRLTGAGNLVVNYSVTGGGVPMPNETWIVQGYGSAVTYAGGSLIIFGETVPSQSALSGEWQAVAIYDDVAATYRCTISSNISDTQWVMDSMVQEVGGTKITTNTIPTAAYGNASVTGAKIASGTITSSNLDATTQAALSAISQVQSVTLTIPTADVLTLNASPVVAVGAQGVGTVIQAIAAFFVGTFNTTAYAAFTDLEIACDGATTPQLSAAGALAFAANRTLQLAPVSGAAASTQLLANTDLVVREPLGDPTLGDSDIVIKLLYRVVSV